MQLAERVRYRASIEAEAGWGHLLSLLRLYRQYGPEGWAGRNWRQELGVRIQGMGGDPMRNLELAISASAAIDDLRRCNVQAYNLIEAEIDDRPLSTDRGQGVRQLMGLSYDEAADLQQRGRQCVWQQAENGNCQDCPFGGPLDT